jgi:RHS repeat-associated protein
MNAMYSIDATLCTHQLAFLMGCESRFTGKERDAESGNDYFGARYYASTMGRFLSPDWSAKTEPVPYAKLDDPQSLNLYAYVGNNPLNRTDPDGHDLLSFKLLPHLDVSQFTSVHEHLSDAGADFIGRGFENPKNKGFNKENGLYYPYDDGYGNSTIGYGHKINTKTEDFSKGLTHDQVVGLFKTDAQAQINAVKKWIPFRLSQREVDALASLHFNTGPNASTIPERHLMSGRDVTLGDFTIYNHADGKVSRGLTIRREREFQIFDEGIYNAAH